MQALATFFAAQCSIAGDHLWPEDAIEEVVKGRLNYAAIVFFKQYTLNLFRITEK